jgi:hypothetical protein
MLKARFATTGDKPDAPLTVEPVVVVEHFAVGHCALRMDSCGHPGHER